MTRTARYISLVAALAAFSAITACSDSVAEVDCKALETRTDAAAKAELEKRCPRRGAVHTPSKVRNW